VVAVVGSLDERKGVGRLPALLRSATGGAGTGGGPASVGVLVAGDGPGRESLRSGLAAVPGVTARLLGHVDEVDRVMAAADVLVLASSAEGLPQVVVQAAASGLPVVAYDVDGVREVAALGAAIGIAPLGDEAALAAALGGALAVAGRRRRRTVAESALAEWDPAAVASRYRRTYAEDLADRGRR
jgi:glycosyltransferase involved in cell wall biosynthesis